MAGRLRTHRSGLTLGELVIVVFILGILAALVIPLFSQGTRQASEAALMNNLREVRAAIAAYRVEHLGVWPGHPNGDTTLDVTEKALRAQLLTRTYTTGVSVPDGATPIDRTYGPYLREIPENPFGGADRVRVIAVAALAGDLNATGMCGWVYRGLDGRFQSDVSGKTIDGKSYEDL
jgi:type II secretory pathway pseudopilin PulG